MERKEKKTYQRLETQMRLEPHSSSPSLAHLPLTVKKKYLGFKHVSVSSPSFFVDVGCYGDGYGDSGDT
jgi:hypothetical protein